MTRSSSCTQRPLAWLGIWGLLVGISLGCVPTVTKSPDPRTPFALTQQAYVATLQATGQVSPSAPTPSLSFPQPTPTPRKSTTPSPTPSPRPTATPTPSGVKATVTGYLYCREGPGPYYKAVAILEPGQEVRLVGQNPIYYAYRVVALDSGARCWAWTRWMTLPNSPMPLAEMTPPPPPPGAFSLPRQYPIVTPFCTAFFGPALLVQVKNRTATPIRSMDVRIEVLDTGAVYRTRVPEGIPTCTKIRTQLRGYERATLAFRVQEDITGKRVRITFKGCTQPQFRGRCVSYTVLWTIESPPMPAWPIPLPSGFPPPSGGSRP